MEGKSHTMHYQHLLIMLVLSAIAMYVLMFAMVNEWADVYMNANNLYMAVLMAAPMGLIELAVMRSMYRHRRLNIVVIAGSLVALAGAWLLIRQQGGISDAQFLRSMIPHHSSAILMCQRAPLVDPEIHALCRSIVQSQQSEIDLMKAMLNSRGQ